MAKRYILSEYLECKKEYILVARFSDGHMCECGGITMPLKYISRKPKRTVKGNG